MAKFPVVFATFFLIPLVLFLAFPCFARAEEITPEQRTADMPDSWLVLYNVNDADSVTWEKWYREQWGIPESNRLGLDVPSSERISVSDFHNKILYPVRNHLAANPELKNRVMGILVGYHVPGNFYQDANTPELQGGGGWSVSNNLQDLQYEGWYKYYTSYYFVAYQEQKPRLSKAAMGRFFLTARIDGPSLSQAEALTTRAREITTAKKPLRGTESLYYDYMDIGSPGGDYWIGLKNAVTKMDGGSQAYLFPWKEYESKTEGTPDCVMQFSYYRVTGWDQVPWASDSPGRRILGFALNSWGATTVRSTFPDAGSRYVPNALFNGGFASAIGATAEPGINGIPDPSTVVWGLSQGWTLGEAFYCANPFLHFMWEVVGDPLLRVPHWFISPAEPPTIVEVRSRKTHGSAGSCDIDLLGQNGAVAMEPRLGGPTLIIVGFNQAIEGMGGLEPTDINVTATNRTPPNINRLSIDPLDNSNLVIELGAIPDSSSPATLNISFGGIQNLKGKPVQEEIHFQYYPGNVNGTGGVDSADLLYLRNNLSKPVNSDNCRADVNADGSINSMDMLLVRNRLGK